MTQELKSRGAKGISEKGVDYQEIFFLEQTFTLAVIINAARCSAILYCILILLNDNTGLVAGVHANLVKASSYISVPQNAYYA